MRKNYLFILLLLVAVICFAKSPALFQAEGQYVLYNGKNGSDAEMIFVENYEQAEKIKKTLKSYSGESICLKDGLIADYFIDKFDAKLVKTESVANVTSYYYYSAKIDFYQLIDGVKVNLHVAKDGEKVYMGSPLIYSGF